MRRIGRPRFPLERGLQRLRTLDFTEIIKKCHQTVNQIIHKLHGWFDFKALLPSYELAYIKLVIRTYKNEFPQQKFNLAHQVGEQFGINCWHGFNRR